MTVVVVGLRSYVVENPVAARLLELAREAEEGRETTRGRQLRDLAVGVESGLIRASDASRKMKQYCKAA
jgi:hypothetical protein